MIKVSKLNESFLRVECEPDIAYELSEAFTFEVPGFKYMPAYKNGQFDGKIRIFHLGKRTLPLGLLDELKKFCREREYTILEDVRMSSSDVTLASVVEYTNSLGFTSRSPFIMVRDYQYEGIYWALFNKRGILVSPTGCMDPNTEIEVELDELSIQELSKIRELSV